MLLSILSVAAKAVVLKSHTEESAKNLVKEANLATDMFTFQADSSLKEDQYVVETKNIPVTLSNAEDLKNILAISEVLLDTPAEIDSILKSVSSLKEDVIQDLKSGAYNFIIIFTKDSKTLLNLKGIEVIPGFKFFICSDESVAKKLNAPFPSVLAYNAIDKNVLNLPIMENVNSIVSAASLSCFSKVNQDSFRALQTLEQPIFYIIDAANNFEKNKQDFIEFMKPLSSIAKFVFFSPEEIPALVQLIDIKDSDYPVLINLSKTSKYAVKNLSKSNFKQSVEDIVNKKATPIKFSSRIPEDNATRAVKVVNTDMIPKLIADTSVDRLVAFTSPRCGYCVSLKPVLEKFANILKENKVEIFIGDYNVIENEEIPGLDANAVPALFFVKKGSYSHTKLPTEVRTLKKLLEYVAQEGVSSKINLADYSAYLTEDKKDEEEDSESGHDHGHDHKHAHSQDKSDNTGAREEL